ncbi:MAG: hypothetical protein QME70_09405 [Bacillota bacterium]|nr:hypothetical protein [Bacillota bacterium]
MAPAYSPLAAGAWIPLLAGLHLILPPTVRGPSALLPVLAWGVFLAGNQASGHLAKALTLLLVWACTAGEAAFHRATRWRFLALLGSLQVVGIEKLRAFLERGLGPPWGHAAWAAAFHAHPLCYPVAGWLGLSAAALAIVLPQFLLVEVFLRLTRPGNRAPADRPPPPGTVRPWRRLRAWLRPGLQVWIRPGMAVLLAVGLLVPWLLPGRVARPAPGSITVAVVQPGWTHRTHPFIRQALQAGDARRVAAVLLEEAEATARRAAEQGARLMVWPLDYLNFDPATDRAGRERLLSLAEVTGAVLVLPFGFWTPDGPAHGVAVVYPDPRGTRGEERLLSRTWTGRGLVFPLHGGQMTFMPLIPNPARPAGGAAGQESAPSVTQLLRQLLGWLGKEAAQAGLAQPGSTLVLTAAPAAFSPLDLVPAAAAAGASLVHAGWGVPDAPARRRGPARRPEGLSLIADAPGWHTTLSPPGDALLLAPVSPGPGPAPLARADPVGLLGVLSLLAGAFLYRRRPTRRAPAHPDDSSSGVR